jgi:cyanate lyase
MVPTNVLFHHIIRIVHQEMSWIRGRTLYILTALALLVVRFVSPLSPAALADRVERVLGAKASSGLSFDDIAVKLGVTNTYAAQLLLGQAKLTKETSQKLAEALPAIDDEDLRSMQSDFPMRTFDSDILKEPHVYRMYEAITHYGVAIKSIINEQCGDGIMSAIDFYCDVGTTTGVNGEKRVVLTLNGKFLPFIEQRLKDNTATSPRD